MNLFSFIAKELTPVSKNSLSRDKYYTQFIEVADIVSFYKSLQEEPLQCFSIQKNISFFEIPFNDKKQDVIKKIGKERHQIVLDANDIRVEILFYKMFFYGFHSVVQFHFIDNKFIFGTVSMKEHNTTVMQFLSSLLSSKYNFHLDESDLGKICLTDINEHKVMYRCLFRPTLIYMSKALENIIATNKSSLSQLQDYNFVD